MAALVRQAFHLAPLPLPALQVFWPPGQPDPACHRQCMRGAHQGAPHCAGALGMHAAELVEWGELMRSHQPAVLPPLAEPHNDNQSYALHCQHLHPAALVSGLQGCTLECDARGLPHLAAPLLTRAISCPPPPPTPVAWAARPGPSSAAAATPATAAASAAAAPLLPTPAASGKRPAAAAAGWAASVKEEAPAAKRLRVWRSAAEAAAGPGVLSVVETRIRVRELAARRGLSGGALPLTPAGAGHAPGRCYLATQGAKHTSAWHDYSYCPSRHSAGPRRCGGLARQRAPVQRACHLLHGPCPGLAGGGLCQQPASQQRQQQRCGRSSGSSSR